jgi:hypothetical protein
VISNHNVGRALHVVQQAAVKVGKRPSELTRVGASVDIEITVEIVAIRSGVISVDGEEEIAILREGEEGNERVDRSGADGKLRRRGDFSGLPSLSLVRRQE